MNRGIGRNEKLARISGMSCKHCGKLHHEQHVAKECERKAERRRAKADKRNER